MHGKEYFSNNQEEVLAKLDKMIPLAAKWHSSVEGVKWHKEHWKNMSEKLLAKDKERSCAWCGTKVMSHLKTKNVYCDRKCEFQYITEKGKTDGKEYECTICGKKFKWHKEKSTCSKKYHKQAAKQNKKEHKYHCKECGEEFTRDRKLKEGRELCSERCAKKHDYVPKQYDPIPCKECGGVFTPKRKSSKFCGNVCSRSWHHRKEADRKRKNV